MALVLLTHETPIKSGGEKLVFLHPHQPGQLIKIINTRYIRYMYAQWPLLIRLQRLAHYWSHQRELMEHIAARAHGVQKLHHMQTITGLADTDLGLGIVITAIVKRNGQLADTLSERIQQGQFGQKEAAALHQFCEWLATAPLIVRDLTTRNLVWDETGEHFVVIDGVGARLRPSLRSLSSHYNRYSNCKKIEKLKQRVMHQLRQHSTAGHLSTG
ncbi:MAG: YrbL family protein [Pseudomonadota bacterium]